MTELCHYEQKTKLNKNLPLLRKSVMPSFYPSTRQRTLISKQLTNRDDDNNDPDSVYKEAFIVEIFQHWKGKALENQHSINNPGNLATSNNFTQALSTKSLSTEITSIQTTSSNTINDKTELSNVTEPQLSTVAINKRTIPSTSVNKRRKALIRQNITASTEVSNPNLLAPYTKSKYVPSNTTITGVTTKKPPKPLTIFIEPKRTQPSLSLRSSYCAIAFDESNQTKHKMTTSEKQNVDNDDDNEDRSCLPISPTWTPHSHLTSSRSYPYSQSSSLYDDETSSDEGNHESLLIRNKRNLKQKSNNQEKISIINLANLTIPSGIYITDPDGNTATFDLNDDSMEEYFRTGRIVENDFLATNKNISNIYDSTVYSPSCTVANVSSTEQIPIDRHTLHSIGEEEEEQEERRQKSVDKCNLYCNMISNESNRLKGSTKSQKLKSNIRKQDFNSNRNEHDQVQYARRWSDSFIGDEENQSLRLPQQGLVKTPSASSIMKQTTTPTPKVSIGKYLLMKLHITPTTQKNDNLNTNSTTTNPQRRKHSRTNLQSPQSSVDESKQPANISRQNSVNTLASPTKSVSQRIPSVSGETDRIIIANNQQDSNKRGRHYSKKDEQDNTDRERQHHTERSQQDLTEMDQRDRIKRSQQDLAKRSQQDLIQQIRKDNIEKDQNNYTKIHQLNPNGRDDQQDYTEQYQQDNAKIVEHDEIEKDQHDNTLKKVESIENQEATADHDITDGKVAKKKGTSQSSLNSAFGDTKSHYDLDISGTIELKICYNMAKSSLDIFIKRCTDLAHLKRNQAPNPYCKIYVLPDDSKTTKRKTHVKKDTTEPEYNEIFRYPLHRDEFNSRVLWVSVWSQTSFGHNYFLGEIHIPLVNCTLDKFEEYTLLSRMSKDNLPQTLQDMESSSELNFDLSFLTNSANTEIGTIQVNAIQAKNVYQGKNNYDIICKGLLMPGNIKRKLAISRKGPSPKWDIPLRWENISRNNLKNMSIEISLWRQERFRKVLMSYVRLNSTHIQFDDKFSKSYDSSQTEKFVWELFLQKPTQIHHVQLPLRSATNENK